jgi:hypothetical protein
LLKGAALNAVQIAKFVEKLWFHQLII